MSNATPERRKHKRRPILESFSLFVTIPKKGGYKLPVHDISDGGIGFDFDLEGESADDYPLKDGEKLDIQFYLNQTLYLPMAVKAVRIVTQDSVRRVGAELQNTQSKEFKSFLSFLAMLDGITETAQLNQS